MDTAEVQTVASAAERAYQHIKTGVMTRRYAPHDLLSEGQLADAVGVSRTPIREALLRLQSEGLLRLLPKRGALVLPVTADEERDVIETRRLVEQYAVRKAITDSPGPALIERLTGHVAAMRAAAKRHDTAGYVRADRDFHAEIVAASGNAILVSLYQSLRERQLRMGVVNLLDESGSAIDPVRYRDTLAEHDQILQAIAGRSLRAAEAAVTRHLDHAEHRLARRA